MQLTLSKRAWFNTFLVSPLVVTSSNYDSHHLTQFPLLPLLFHFYKKSSALNQLFLHTRKTYQPCTSSAIGSERASYFLFAAGCRVEEKNKAKTSVILEKKSDVDANEAYFYSSFEDLNLDVDSLSSFSGDDDDD